MLSALALQMLSADPSRRPCAHVLRTHPLFATPMQPPSSTKPHRALGPPCATTVQLADAHRVISAQEGEIDLLKRQLQAAQEELSRLQVAGGDGR